MATEIDTLKNGRAETTDDARVRFWIDGRRFIEVYRSTEGGIEIYTSGAIAVLPHVTNRVRIILAD